MSARVSALVGAIAFAALAHTAHASPVAPGYDYFSTVSGAGGSEVDMSFLLPSVGVIDLEGWPFDPNGTDTIVQRLQGIDPFEVCPTAPCAGTIDIEIVALSLRSVSPVDLSDLGGPFLGVFADVYTTINKGGIVPGLPQPDALNPSIGQMEIIHDDPSGGTFESCVGIASDPAGACSTLGVPGGGQYANGIFTVVGGDPSNPLDVFFSVAMPRLAVSGLTGAWAHDPAGEGDLLVLGVANTCNFPPCHIVEPAFGPTVPKVPTMSRFGIMLVVSLLGLSGLRRLRG